MINGYNQCFQLELWFFLPHGFFSHSLNLLDFNFTINYRLDKFAAPIYITMFFVSVLYATILPNKKYFQNIKICFFNLFLLSIILLTSSIIIGIVILSVGNLLMTFFLFQKEEETFFSSSWFLCLLCLCRR